MVDSLLLTDDNAAASAYCHIPYVLHAASQQQPGQHTCRIGVPYQINALEPESQKIVYPATNILQAL
jgi:hypothetical protein